MAKIYDELKHLVSGGALEKLTSTLGVSNTHAEKSAGQLLPTLLSKFMTKSDSPQLLGLLKDAAGSKKGIGEKFVSAIMGSQESTLNSLVAKDGVSAPAAKGLTAGLGALVAGFLGKRVLQHGGPKPVMEELASEKNAILADVPAEWKEKFHLSPDTMHCAAPAHKAAAHHAAPKKKKKWGWLWWLLGLIVLALLLCLLFCKGCTGCSKKVEAPVEEVVVQPVEPSDTYELTLPSGEKLTVRQGGMIDKMVTFLNSDAYKNGDEDVMRKHWFEFENVDFKFDSSTEFEDGSIDVVENRLAFLLKYFPDVKIRFGGNADMKGRDGYNQALSVARAETIKKLLVAKGIDENRITTRGFGEENAVIPATETDAERAPDRDFALRFQK